MPSKFLDGDKPRLFDEWQDFPEVWGAIRKDVDDTGLKGQYILTGSSSKNVETPHTGTLRISRLDMYPMSLYESGESNGKVSLEELFDNPEDFDFCKSDLSVDELIFSLCRGGWPGCINTKSDRAKLEIAKELYNMTSLVDISNIDNVRRSPDITKSILRSYSRNICTLATNKTMYMDVSSNNELSEATFYSYIDALKRLYIIDDVPSWSPDIRSKTVIRASKKRNLTDPSIAVAALGLSPEYFNKDLRTFGFLFESLCIRDLKIYSYAHGGSFSYYNDKYGLEVDGVLHLGDGRYALLEFKLGSNEIEKGASNLLKIESLIRKHNKDVSGTIIRMPDLKIVITGGNMV